MTEIEKKIAKKTIKLLKIKSWNSITVNDILY